MYDYNDLGIKCCCICPSFYNCIFNIYEYFADSNIIALEETFVSQKKIDDLKKNNKKILVWNMTIEEANHYTGIDFLLV